jgi:ubiquinone/menaquinone biosynthesis C-methylase UbiE
MTMNTSLEFFDARAPSWEQTCYPPSVRARLAELIPCFGLAPGDRVLDIGTGPGILLPYIQECVGAAGRIVALDRSLPMVVQADGKRRRFRDLVLQADVHRLPFADQRFDAVICFAAFPHFQTPARAMAEMARVAVPGGRVVIAHLMSRRQLAKHHGHQRAVRGHELPGETEMKALMRAAGLVGCRIVDEAGRYLATGERPMVPSNRST